MPLYGDTSPAGTASSSTFTLSPLFCIPIGSVNQGYTEQTVKEESDANFVLSPSPPKREKNQKVMKTKKIKIPQSALHESFGKTF